MDIQDSEDPEGLRVFYYLVQDLRVRHPTTFFYYFNICDNFCPMSSYSVHCFLPDLIALQDQAYITTRSHRTDLP